jgi:hypothetical protein
MGHKKLTTDNPSDFYPEFLRNVKQRSSRDLSSDRPTLVRMEEPGAKQTLEKLVKESANLEIIDNYDEQYAELLLSRNAHLYRANYDVQVASISKLLEDHFAGEKPWSLGTWAHFPWKNQLVHILAQKDFEDLRTIRNRDLILPEEQVKLFNFEAVCFGMSVGSAGALALGISGISRRLKLVDGAVISGSNLNRILTGVSSVGQSKAVTIARQIYEMNPYSDIQNFDKVDAENIGEILDQPWQVKVVVDEIDDIEMKVRIRAEARERGIPVVMATELGDTVMLDVERFDLEPKRPLFHGMVPGVEKLLESKVENYREWTKHAVGIIDPSNMPIKMQQSLLKIGNTIVTHPQLGSTVMVTGGILAFAVKSLALEHPLESGRYVISLEKELLADHKTRKYKRAHKKHTKVIKTAVKSM